MAQTREGAIKNVAKALGISPGEFSERIASGLKHCRLCRVWHSTAVFGKDRSRGDGLATSCKNSLSRWRAEHYIPRERTSPPGPPPAPPRSEDRKQARRRINVEVRSGRRPHPKTLPCTDCGHEWKEDERRHEYDHYLGYAAEHHCAVEPVCTTCHRRRATARGEIEQHRAANGTYTAKE